MPTNRYAIHPVARVSDETLGEVFLALEYEGLLPVVFYDGSVVRPVEFLALARATWLKFYVLTVESYIKGLAWLTNFEGCTARAHFTTLCHPSPADAAGMGRHFLRWVLTAEVDGRPWLRTLVGVTPVTNRLALNFATKRLGFRPLGVIPDAVLVDGRPVDAVVTTINRRDV